MYRQLRTTTVVNITCSRKKNNALPLSSHQHHIINNNAMIRSLSLFNKMFIGSPSRSSSSPEVRKDHPIEDDLDHAIKLVQKYDPVGYLPGLLVTNQAKLGYFAGKQLIM